MNYQETAAAIVRHIGGKENVQNVTHCVTRLRFTLADESKVDAEALKAVPGVLKLVVSSGQYQVVIGAAVGDVYKETIKLVDIENMDGTPMPASETKGKRGIIGLPKQALDTLIACFVPSISVIAGAGMIKVLVVLLDFMHILPADSSTYAILNTIGDSVFYFLPFFVAYNAARKMDVDIFLAMALAAIVLHPNLAALGEAGSSIGFLAFSMKIMDYSAQALPMVFGVWLLKYVDKFADKVSPKIVKVFLRPMISLLITASVILLLIGPAALVLSNLFLNFARLCRHGDGLLLQLMRLCSRSWF